VCVYIQMMSTIERESVCVCVYIQMMSTIERERYMCVRIHSNDVYDRERESGRVELAPIKYKHVRVERGGSSRFRL